MFGDLFKDFFEKNYYFGKKINGIFISFLNMQ